MRRQSEWFGYDERTCHPHTYLRTLKDTVSSAGHGPAPWWYVMALAVVLAMVGGITGNALALRSGLSLGGVFVIFWLVVGAIEYRRHR